MFRARKIDSCGGVLALSQQAGRKLFDAVAAFFGGAPCQAESEQQGDEGIPAQRLAHRRQARRSEMLRNNRRHGSDLLSRTAHDSDRMAGLEWQMG